MQVPPELAAAKQAIVLARHGNAKGATELVAWIGDPVAAKLVEWTFLRHGDGEAGFNRYDAFRGAGPIPIGRASRCCAGARRSRLWQERRDGPTIRRFVGQQPASALGRLALARAEAAEAGDRSDAASEIRAVWQSAPLSAELETAVLAAFPDTITRSDDIARMDRRIGAKDFGAAMRAAKRAGGDHVAIIKACTAAEAKAGEAKALLDAVPADARNDLGYALCRVHWLLRNDTPGSNIKALS